MQVVVAIIMCDVPLMAAACVMSTLKVASSQVSTCLYLKIVVVRLPDCFMKLPLSSVVACFSSEPAAAC